MKRIICSYTDFESFNEGYKACLLRFFDDLLDESLKYLPLGYQCVYEIVDDNLKANFSIIDRKGNIVAKETIDILDFKKICDKIKKSKLIEDMSEYAEEMGNWEFFNNTVEKLSGAVSRANDNYSSNKES